MKKLFAILALFTLTGCNTPTPVTDRYPADPGSNVWITVISNGHTNTYPMQFGQPKGTP